MAGEDTGAPAGEGSQQSAGEKALAEGRLIVGDRSENGAFETDAGGKAKAVDGNDAALDLTPKPEGEQPEGDAPETETPEETDLKEGKQGDSLEDLGEYKADDPETVAKFDKRFINEDGTLNERAIGEEFWGDYANLKDGETGDLRPATRAYLKDTFKVSDAFIDQTRDGLVALQVQRDTEFANKFGGKEAVTAAIAWAKGGGYTPEQRARFNALQKEGGEAFSEAVELLISRHGAASGGKAQGSREGLPGRRQSTPARQATKTATPGGSTNAQGLFQTKAEYQEAWTQSLREEKAARKNKANDREAWVKADARVQELRKLGAKSAKLWK